ncbi:hypothetical protein D3C86_1888630 [compost metagenome]
MAAAREGDLQDRYSSMELEGAEVMIESVKKAEDEDALVVRLYETSGASRDVHLWVHLPHQEAVLADLMEHPLELLECQGGSYQLSFKPFEVITVLIRLSNIKV